MDGIGQPHALLDIIVASGTEPQKQCLTNVKVVFFLLRASRMLHMFEIRGYYRTPYYWVLSCCGMNVVCTPEDGSEHDSLTGECMSCID